MIPVGNYKLGIDVGGTFTDGVLIMNSLLRSYSDFCMNIFFIEYCG